MNIRTEVGEGWFGSFPPSVFFFIFLMQLASNRVLSAVGME